MPFGQYPDKKCKTPECGEMFSPNTPWQTHCKPACRDHHRYLRTVVPRRRKEARMAGRKR
jgi:hypothetical protein